MHTLQDLEDALLLPPTSLRHCLQAKKVDYRQLPQPVRYEELQREVMSEWVRGEGDHPGRQAVWRAPPSLPLDATPSAAFVT